MVIELSHTGRCGDSDNSRRNVAEAAIGRGSGASHFQLSCGLYLQNTRRPAATAASGRLARCRRSAAEDHGPHLCMAAFLYKYSVLVGTDKKASNQGNQAGHEVHDQVLRGDRPRMTEIELSSPFERLSGLMCLKEVHAEEDRPRFRVPHEVHVFRMMTAHGGDDGGGLSSSWLQACNSQRGRWHDWGAYHSVSSTPLVSTVR